MTSFRNQKNDIQKERGRSSVPGLSLPFGLFTFLLFLAKTADPTPATPVAPIAIARGEETLTSYSEEKPSAEVAITVTVLPFNVIHAHR